MADVLAIALAGASPHIAADAWIAPGAAVVGNVRLGSRSSVWYGAVLRGDDELIEIGPGSNVQDNCVLHADEGAPARVGANVTIGHNATVHGARIGDGVLIGMNTVLLNGSVIGEGCVIGAGAVVPEGMIVPPRSLVLGLPGKVHRGLSQDEVTRNLHSALAYRARAERHRRQARDFAVPAAGPDATG